MFAYGSENGQVGSGGGEGEGEGGIRSRKSGKVGVRFDLWEHNTTTRQSISPLLRTGSAFLGLRASASSALQGGSVPPPTCSLNFRVKTGAKRGKYYQVANICFSSINRRRYN